MELGNLIFGNSRGPIEVNFDLVNSKEWEYLVHTLLQVEDYHCYLGDYYQDYSTTALNSIKRTNNLTPNSMGGYTCVVDGEVIFEINPYYWGDCDCGAEEKNIKIERKLKNKIFTPYQWKTYNTYEEYCEDTCPGCDYIKENKDKTPEELDKLCTCGNRAFNRRLIKRKAKLIDKINEFNEKLSLEEVDHTSDCSLVKHNFIYHPGKEDEVWIDWYKYPFRDSYTNCGKDDTYLKEIFIKCSKILEKVILDNKGTWKK